VVRQERSDSLVGFDTLATAKFEPVPLEGRVQEQAAFMNDLRSLGAEFRQGMRDLREEIRDLREGMDHLREQMNHLREDLRQEMDRRFEGMERRFAWLVGIVITGFVAVIGTVASAFWGVLQVVR
jgi:soluble cytochrome b562